MNAHSAHETRRLIGAETMWLLRRRYFRIAQLAAAVVLAGFFVVRFLPSSDDVAGAIRDARLQVAEAAARGLDIPLAGMYREPRYVLAAQAPVDLASAGLILGLIGFCAAAMCIGSAWRTGAVRLSFIQSGRRFRPAVIRILTWATGWFAGSLALLLLLAGGLTLTAMTRGYTEGINAVPLLLVVLRAALLTGAAAAVGASLATLLRNEIPILVALLLYVLVAEVLMPALRPGGLFRSPGRKIIDFVVSQDLGAQITLNCAAPRCDIAYVPAGGLVAALVAIPVLVVLVGGSAISANRPVWS